MRKKTYLLLSLLLVFAMCLGACGKDDESGTSKKSKKKTDVSTEEDIDTSATVSSVDIVVSSEPEYTIEDMGEPIAALNFGMVYADSKRVLSAFPDNLVQQELISALTEYGISENDYYACINATLAETFGEYASGNPTLTYLNSTELDSDSINAYQDLLRTTDPASVVSQGYTIEADGDGDIEFFNVYLVNGKWTLDYEYFELTCNTFRSILNEAYGQPSATTLEEILNDPELRAALGEGPSDSVGLERIELRAHGNSIYYLYHFADGFTYDMESLQSLDYQSLCLQLKDAFEDKFGIRPDEVGVYYVDYEDNYVYGEEY